MSGVGVERVGEGKGADRNNDDENEDKNVHTKVG